MRRCFPLMPMGERDSDTRRRANALIRNVLRPALEPLGIEVEEPDIERPGPLVQQVLASVLDADLVVADLTDANPNVCFEAGVRKQAEKPAILISRNLETIPFDLKGEKTIPFDDTTPAGIDRAIDDIRTYARNVLGDPQPEPRAWQITASESFEENASHAIDSEVQRQLTGLMLQRIAHDPLGGEPVTIDGRAMYAIRAKARGTASALRLVYGVDVQNRLVQPAFFLPAV